MYDRCLDLLQLVQRIGLRQFGTVLSQARAGCCRGDTPSLTARGGRGQPVPPRSAAGCASAPSSGCGVPVAGPRPPPACGPHSGRAVHVRGPWRPSRELESRADALAAYARQRDGRELEVWFSEIRLRATIRLGELVRELDSAQGARTDLKLLLRA